jgi:hypothetical protein
MQQTRMPLARVLNQDFTELDPKNTYLIMDGLSRKMRTYHPGSRSAERPLTVLLTTNVLQQVINYLKKHIVV